MHVTARCPRSSSTLMYSFSDCQMRMPFLHRKYVDKQAHPNSMARLYPQSSSTHHSETCSADGLQGGKGGAVLRATTRFGSSSFKCVSSSQAGGVCAVFRAQTMQKVRDSEPESSLAEVYCLVSVTYTSIHIDSNV